MSAKSTSDLDEPPPVDGERAQQAAVACATGRRSTSREEARELDEQREGEQRRRSA